MYIYIYLYIYCWLEANSLFGSLYSSFVYLISSVKSLNFVLYFVEYVDLIVDCDKTNLIQVTLLDRGRGEWSKGQVSSLSPSAPFPLPPPVTPPPPHYDTKGGENSIDELCRGILPLPLLCRWGGREARKNKGIKFASLCTPPPSVPWGERGKEHSRFIYHVGL